MLSISLAGREGIIYFSSAYSSFHNFSMATDIAAGRFTPFSAQIRSSFSMMARDNPTVIFFDSGIPNTSTHSIPLSYHHVNILSTAFPKIRRGGDKFSFLSFLQYQNKIQAYFTAYLPLCGIFFTSLSPAQSTKHPRGGVVVPPLMLYRFPGRGGRATRARAATPPCPACGGAYGGFGPRTPKGGSLRSPPRAATPPRGGSPRTPSVVDALSIPTSTKHAFLLSWPYTTQQKNVLLSWWAWRPRRSGPRRCGGGAGCGGVACYSIVALSGSRPHGGPGPDPPALGGHLRGPPRAARSQPGNNRPGQPCCPPIPIPPGDDRPALDMSAPDGAALSRPGRLLTTSNCCAIIKRQGRLPAVGTSVPK